MILLKFFIRFKSFLVHSPRDHRDIGFFILTFSKSYSILLSYNRVFLSNLNFFLIFFFALIPLWRFFKNIWVNYLWVFLIFFFRLLDSYFKIFKRFLTFFFLHSFFNCYNIGIYCFFTLWRVPPWVLNFSLLLKHWLCMLMWLLLFDLSKIPWVCFGLTLWFLSFAFSNFFDFLTRLIVKTLTMSIS